VDDNEQRGIEERNAATLARMSDGFRRHDVDAILDTFAEDGRFDITRGPDPWGERFQGKPAIRKALEQLFAGIADVQFVDATSWVKGDRGTSEWTCVGTTAKGRPIRVRGCDLFEFRNGLITCKDSYFKQVVEPRP
jgi:ketosteroid isomerase-like protein